jgi:hypothetical protein
VSWDVITGDILGLYQELYFVTRNLYEISSNSELW